MGVDAEKRLLRSFFTIKSNQVHQNKYYGTIFYERDMAIFQQQKKPQVIVLSNCAIDSHGLVIRSH